MTNYQVILPIRRVCKSREITSRQQVLNKLAKLMTVGVEMDERELAAALLAREQLGSTALDGVGVAVPHCRLSDCAAPIAALLHLQSSVQFGDDAVDIIFGLVVPADATQEHLEILGNIARVLKDANHLGCLRATSSESDLHRTFHEQLHLVKSK